MKINTLRAGIVVSIFIFNAILSFATVQAAPQSIAVPTEINLTDDPRYSANPTSSTLGDFSSTISIPVSETQTALDSPEGGYLNNFYTWRLSLPTICQGAVISGLRVMTNTDSNLTSPIRVVGLRIYGGSDLTSFDQYIINDGLGEDMNTWWPPLGGEPNTGIGRGHDDNGIFAPAGLDVGGQLDGTWDISGYVPGEPLGIAVSHYEIGGEVGETIQTTIQSVTLLYDDAGCVAASGANSSDAGGVSAPLQSRLADTGSNTAPIWLLSLTLLLTGSYVAKRSLRLNR